jgi:hypothetical protein
MALLAASLLTAVGIAAWRLHCRERTYLTDGAGIREPVSSARARQVLWQPPQPLAPAINSSADESEPRLTADGPELFFARERTASIVELYTSAWSERHGWTEPAPLTWVMDEANDPVPRPSADGSALYFSSCREGGFGGHDVWVAVRQGSEWLPPINLGPAVNTAYDECGPALSPDGQRLYFASNRPSADAPGQAARPPVPATLRESSGEPDYDVFTAQRISEGFGPAEAMDVLNTPANEGAPAVSPAGDFLYFASDRADGEGGFDLYRSRLLRGAAQPPENLGPAVNTPSDELDPALGLGGFALLFSSNRDDRAEQHQYDLYQTTSREVFVEVDADFALFAHTLLWPALWALLWFLLALLALLLLVTLLRDGRLHQLSLLVRCLLSSLIIHFILMFVFMLWQVGSGLAERWRQGDGIRIALAVPAGSQELASQLRGELASGPISTPAPVPSARAMPEAVAQPALATAHILPPSAVPIDIPADLSIRGHELEADPQRARSRIVFPSLEQPADLALAVPIVPGPVGAAEQTVELPALLRDAALPRADRADTTGAAARDMPIRLVSIQPPQASSGHPLSFGQESSPVVPVDAAPARPQNALADARITVPALETAEQVAAMPAPGSHGATTEVVLEELSGINPTAAPAARALPSLPLAAIDAGSPQPAAGLDAIERISMPPLPSAGATPDHPPAEAEPKPLVRPVEIEDALPTVAMDIPEPSTSAIPEAPQRPEPGAELSITIEVAPAQCQAKPFHSSVMPSETPPHPGRQLLTPESSVPLIEPLPFKPVFVAPEAAAALRPQTAIDLALAPMHEPDTIDLRLPQTAAPPDPYQQRDPQRREEIVKRMGGSDATERAVAAALRWLAAHQSADGRWDADRFDEACGRCGGGATFDADIATTGLALLCFLGAGHTHLIEGEYQAVVRRGIDWLRAQQGRDGDLRGQETMYSHGIASIALSEAFGMTRDTPLRGSVVRAVEFIVRARSDASGGGGWRYEPGQAGDTSVLGWQVMALVSARRAGCEVPEEALETARQYLDSAADGSARGLYAYQPGQRPTHAMTAEAMFAQQLLGRARREPRMVESAEHLAASLPHWRSRPNTYYWYYATMALFQHQGEPWQRWNERLTEQLLGSQETEGAAAGSWDPLDRWSRIGGRIYQTALCTLCLEVYYRYLPLYAIEPGD